MGSIGNGLPAGGRQVIPCTECALLQSHIWSSHSLSWRWWLLLQAWIWCHVDGCTSHSSSAPAPLSQVTFASDTLETPSPLVWFQNLIFLWALVSATLFSWSVFSSLLIIVFPTVLPRQVGQPVPRESLVQTSGVRVIIHCFLKI